MRSKISFALLLSFLYCRVLVAGEVADANEAAAAAPRSEKTGYPEKRHIPILYEAYYPEPRQWSPKSSLQEIEKLRELTSRLLKEEEQLEQLAAAAVEAVPENIFEPRSQILEYVFSRPIARSAEPAPIVKPNKPKEEDVQVTSITVSESAPRHRTRHHHGQADWLVRRLTPGSRR